VLAQDLIRANDSPRRDTFPRPALGKIADSIVGVGPRCAHADEIASRVSIAPLSSAIALAAAGTAEGDLNSKAPPSFQPSSSFVVKNVQNSIVMREKAGAETMSPSIAQGAPSASARRAPG
jgi:hypothetical protein